MCRERVTDNARRLRIPAEDQGAWRPSASRDVLAARANMLSACREFFAARNVLEVETPLLSSAVTTDPAIESIRARRSDVASGYLATSPEFAMKRLLAAGSGDIYQICKAFRDGERGDLHNPEFTLLEWYRLGFDLEALMHEVAALLGFLLGDKVLAGQVRYCSYRELFRAHLDLDPITATPAELGRKLAQHAVALPSGVAELDELLDLAMAAVIVPALAPKQLTFVFDYPVSQAALAKVHPQDPALARRFEVIYRGIELANGFEELEDAGEQERRFLLDLAKRNRSGRSALPMDRRLLAALAHGLPTCAGVAVGLDRVLMLACDVATIDQVLAFPIENA